MNLINLGHFKFLLNIGKAGAQYRRKLSDNHCAFLNDIRVGPQASAGLKIDRDDFRGDAQGMLGLEVR